MMYRWSKEVLRAIFFLLTLSVMVGSVLFYKDLAEAANKTYYVSGSSGNDAFDGLTVQTPLKSITRVNELQLFEGDSVLFKCGDTWQGEMLRIEHSGTENNPILFGYYSDNDRCNVKPVISGSLPLAGWTSYSNNIYVANLSSGDNAGKFANGINQLFKNGERLMLGRWPNLDDDAYDNGYTIADGHDAAAVQIIDNELPAMDWTGAVMHMKGRQWYIMNREVEISGTGTLTLNVNPVCLNTYDCTGWGYFINSHLNTLDREGEWYYDSNTNHVYLYTLQGPPADNTLEGSVIIEGKHEYDTTLGGIIVGETSLSEVSNVIIDGFHIKNWFDNGITTPTSLEINDNSNLIIRNNRIDDVNGIGINLRSAIWNLDGGKILGGENITVRNNEINGPNEYGIQTYTINSFFLDNKIKNIGLIENLGRDGMGCEFDQDEACTPNGSGILLSTHHGVNSGYGNVFSGNHLQRIGYTGIEQYAPENVIIRNLIEEPCHAKADCSGIHAYSEDSFEYSTVYDAIIAENIIIDSIGNTDGCRYDYKLPLFGFGINFEHYSRNMKVTGNTIINSNAAGILFWWRSTGTIAGNTLYGNGASEASEYRSANGQIEVWDDDSDPGTEATVVDNILFATEYDQYLLKVTSSDNILFADNNYYFNPFEESAFHITSPNYRDLTFAQWRDYSGQDANSITTWYKQSPGEEPLSEIFYNASNTLRTIDLGNDIYYDLDQNMITGSIDLSPYKSRILIKSR